jgi:hypothetical protein
MYSKPPYWIEVAIHYISCIIAMYCLTVKLTGLSLIFIGLVAINIIVDEFDGELDAD